MVAEAFQAKYSSNTAIGFNRFSFHIWSYIRITSGNDVIINVPWIVTSQSRQLRYVQFIISQTAFCIASMTSPVFVFRLSSWRSTSEEILAFGGYSFFKTGRATVQKLLVGREPFLLSQLKNNLLGLRNKHVALYCNMLNTSRRPKLECFL